MNNDLSLFSLKATAQRLSTTYITAFGVKPVTAYYRRRSHLNVNNKSAWAFFFRKAVPVRKIKLYYFES